MPVRVRTKEFINLGDLVKFIQLVFAVRQCPPWLGCRYAVLG
jgi:hypothetical protein